MKLLICLALVVAVANSSREISAKSCAQLGAIGSVDASLDVGFGSPLVCAASRITSGSNNPNGHTCATATDYESATNMCHAIGARLCTSDELSGNEAKHSGCNLDLERVWSSTEDECPDGATATQAGGADYLEEHPITCTDQTDDLFVRCCADACPDPCAGNPCGNGKCSVPSDGDDRQFNPGFAPTRFMNPYAFPPRNPIVGTVGAVGNLGGLRLPGMVNRPAAAAANTCSKAYTCSCDAGFTASKGLASRCVAEPTPAPAAPAPKTPPTQVLKFPGQVIRTGATSPYTSLIGNYRLPTQPRGLVSSPYGPRNYGSSIYGSVGYPTSNFFGGYPTYNQFGRR